MSRSGPTLRAIASCPATAYGSGWIVPAARGAARAGPRAKANCRLCSKTTRSSWSTSPPDCWRCRCRAKRTTCLSRICWWRVCARRGKRRPLVVHRIDRDTSGLVVFAFRPEAHAHLKDQFRRHEALRVYLAVVYGHPSPDAGTWEDTLAWDDRAMIQKETHPRDPRGKAAVCHYVVRELFRETSLLEVTLVTGRRNQIRLQARARGHTLVGERRYVYGPETLRPIPFPRQALHAHRLGFVHPSTGRQLSFEAPLPADMAALVEALRNSAHFVEPSGPRDRSKGRTTAGPARAVDRGDRR